MRTKMLVIGCLAIMLSLSGALSASAYQYGFYNITNNNTGDAAIGEAQLFMDVTQVGGNIVFKFTNIGPAASSITDIYFDDDVPLLMTPPTMTASSGVDFGLSAASPSNLPGGQVPVYHFSSNYSYDSDPPAQPNGINPNEWLEISFGFMTGSDFNTVINALNAETFRVGIHVQGFASRGSESFINRPPVTPPSQVPEPGTLLLLGAGLLGLLGFGRKLKK